MPTPAELQSLCPCNSQMPLQSCCWPKINESETAQTAEQLMRSRYTAYYLKAAPYLLKTQSLDFQSEDLAQHLARQFASDQGWIRLDVIKNQAKGDRAKVEFKAYFHEQNQVYCLHERSNFIRQEKQWLYTDGKILGNGPFNWPRNDSCWCGSGKKHKHCQH